MRMVRAFFNILVYRIMAVDNPSSDDIKNSVMIAGDIIRRCNYAASLEGLVVSRIIRKNVIEEHLAGGISFWINGFIVAIEFMINFADDFVGY